MNQIQNTQTQLMKTIGLISAIEALALLVGAVVHLGVQIPIGVMVLTEPQIIPATIVEGFCGLILARGAYAAFTSKPWAWKAMIGAQVIALGGILLGIVVSSFGPNTASNALFHRVMLGVIIASLLLLSFPMIQSVLSQNNSVSYPWFGKR